MRSYYQPNRLYFADSNILQATHSLAEVVKITGSVMVLFYSALEQIPEWTRSCDLIHIVDFKSSSFSYALPYKHLDFDESVKQNKLSYLYKPRAIKHIPKVQILYRCKLAFKYMNATEFLLQELNEIISEYAFGVKPLKQPSTRRSLLT